MNETDLAGNEKREPASAAPTPAASTPPEAANEVLQDEIDSIHAIGEDD